MKQKNTTEREISNVVSAQHPKNFTASWMNQRLLRFSLRGAPSWRFCVSAFGFSSKFLLVLRALTFAFGVKRCGIWLNGTVHKFNFLGEKKIIVDRSAMATTFRQQANTNENGDGEFSKNLADLHMATLDTREAKISWNFQRRIGEAISVKVFLTKIAKKYFWEKRINWIGYFRLL